MPAPAFLLLLALLFAAAGGAAGWAWQHLRCQRQLAEWRHLALRDPVTGLPNQAALLDILSQQLSLADRLQRPVTVLMLEVDDHARWQREEPMALRHGLQVLAQRMTQRARTHDVLGRWDEAHFFAILPDSDVASALVLVEDLHLLCKNPPPQWQGRPLAITLSTGVHGRSPSPAEPLHDMAAEMVVAAQRALEATLADGPGRIEIEP